jgi:hypothetical protein
VPSKYRILRSAFTADAAARVSFRLAFANWAAWSRLNCGCNRVFTLPGRHSLAITTSTVIRHLSTTAGCPQYKPRAHWRLTFGSRSSSEVAGFWPPVTEQERGFQRPLGASFIDLAFPYVILRAILPRERCRDTRAMKLGDTG